jgi:hypothetical protein
MKVFQPHFILIYLVDSLLPFAHSAGRALNLNRKVRKAKFAKF